MRLRIGSVLLVLLTACASAPAPQLMPRPHAFASTLTSGPRIRLVSAPMEPTPGQAWIGKADLDKARALLSRAREELEPRQWEQLDRKLTAAEQAFERFSRAARTSGQSAEVARGAQGLAQAGCTRTLAEALPEWARCSRCSFCSIPPAPPGLRSSVARPGSTLSGSSRHGCGTSRSPRGNSWWNLRPSLVRRKHRPGNRHRESSPRPPSPKKKTTRGASPSRRSATLAEINCTTRAPTGFRTTVSLAGMCS